MESKIYNFATQWECRAYLNNDGFREEVIIEEPDSNVLAELDRQGLHYGIDGLDMVHLDVEEFEEYLNNEEY